MDLQIDRCVVYRMADDVKDREEGEDEDENLLLLMNHQKRIDVKDGEIGTKAEEQYGLWYEGVVI